MYLTCSSPNPEKGKKIRSSKFKYQILIWNRFNTPIYHTCTLCTYIQTGISDRFINKNYSIYQ
jgi:hypothetical protein